VTGTIDTGERTVVVTGAAGGIGSKVCTRLAAGGYRIVAMDKKLTSVGDIVANLPGQGHTHHEIDNSDRAAWHAWLADLAGRTGHVAGLVHLAAELRRASDVFSISEDDWDSQIDTNLKSTFFLDRAVASQMIANGNPGSIVNFASQGWWTGGLSGSLVYAASKGGVVTLTRGLARTLAPHRIRVNVVVPGFVDTPMMRSGMSDAQLQSSIDMVPLGRMAAPEEIADVVAFLVGEESRYVTGATLNVTGGQLMY
jgi:NAD(P)-dependent dehydrogenase (short-subunit alcohol dehydrogenase family)